MAGARGGRSPETVPIQSVSLELFIAISVACGDICPRAAGPACRRGPPSPRNTCCAAQNRVVPIARRGPGRKTRPARPPCCGWPASWSISPSRGRKNSRVTRLCARTWLEFRAAALKSPSRGRPGRQGFSADTNRRILSHVGLGQPLGTAPDHSTSTRAIRIPTDGSSFPPWASTPTRPSPSFTTDITAATFAGAGVSQCCGKRRASGSPGSLRAPGAPGLHNSSWSHEVEMQQAYTAALERECQEAGIPSLEPPSTGPANDGVVYFYTGQSVPFATFEHK